MGTERNVTVECQFGVGTGTPDLAVVVRFNRDRDPAVEAYPQASGQVTGEAGLVEQALEAALERVREARGRYTAARGEDTGEEMACLYCTGPITNKLRAVRHVSLQRWSHLTCARGADRA